MRYWGLRVAERMSGGRRFHAIRWRETADPKSAKKWRFEYYTLKSLTNRKSGFLTPPDTVDSAPVCRKRRCNLAPKSAKKCQNHGRKSTILHRVSLRSVGWCRVGSCRVGSGGVAFSKKWTSKNPKHHSNPTKRINHKLILVRRKKNCRMASHAVTILILY